MRGTELVVVLLKRYLEPFLKPLVFLQMFLMNVLVLRRVLVFLETIDHVLRLY